jgi:SAM-dependent methyltransferase
MKALLRAPYHGLFRAVLRLRWWFADRAGLPHAPVPIPPAKLRYKVSENNSIHNFLIVGERSVDCIESALQALGESVDKPLTVLDFGCGCGRTLAWLTKRFPGMKCSGTDTDQEAIAWCRANLPATFTVNRASPPLDATGSQFDLIYAISVFTHLDEPQQQAWLAEFARLLKPGGWLLLSVYGEHIWKVRPEAEEVIEQGFVFRTSMKHKGILPEWYHTAFQSRERIIRNASVHFAEVRYVPRGFGDHDLVAARKG